MLVLSPLFIHSRKGTCSCYEGFGCSNCGARMILDDNGDYTTIRTFDFPSHFCIDSSMGQETLLISVLLSGVVVIAQRMRNAMARVFASTTSVSVTAIGYAPIVPWV